MKQKFIKLFRYFLISFGALFTLRLMYGFVVKDTSADAQSEYGYTLATQTRQDNNSNDQSLRKNYASEKKLANAPAAGQHKEKYEKVGSLGLVSREFESDEKKLRGLITAQKGIIQSEQNTGLAGHRTLNLSVGVDPERFDALIAAARTIGDLVQVQITKSDKTNEYKTLNAKRVSQEKYRNSLISLKGRGGKVSELVELEHKILEIEEEIQNLGVKLGDFDEENEFCTVRIILSESRGALKSGFFSNFLRRVRSAFEWTVQYYLMTALLFLFASLAILVSLLIAERLGFIKTLLSRFADEPVKKKK